MKAILISDHAKWCALMMNGDKTVEVRKGTALYKATQKLIDEYGFAEFYVYCTKNEELYKFSWSKTWYENFKHFDDMGSDQAHALDSDNLNGKVLFKFRCYKVEEVKFIMDYIYGGYYNTNSYTNEKCFERDCCLTQKELDVYINKDNYYKRDKIGCALYISNLEIFDKPKELSEFNHWVFYKKCKKCPYGKSDYDYGLCSQCCEIKSLTKAPQSWCYIETGE